jgi:hypothetical protein
VWPACRCFPIRSLSLKEKTGIIGVVEDDKPLPVLLVPQPAINELDYICLWVPTIRDLDLVRDFPITLLETGVVACVYPENPCLGGLVSNLVGVFDCKLRLSTDESEEEIRRLFSRLPNSA